MSIIKLILDIFQLDVNSKEGIDLEREAHSFIKNNILYADENGEYSENVEESLFERAKAAAIVKCGKEVRHISQGNPPENLRLNMAAADSFLKSTGPAISQLPVYAAISLETFNTEAGEIIFWQIDNFVYVEFEAIENPQYLEFYGFQEPLYALVRSEAHPNLFEVTSLTPKVAEAFFDLRLNFPQKYQLRWK